MQMPTMSKMTVPLGRPLLGVRRPEAEMCDQTWCVDVTGARRNTLKPNNNACRTKTGQPEDANGGWVSCMMQSKEVAVHFEFKLFTKNAEVYV